MRRPVEPRTAVVTGATGQDGYYLVRRLLAEGWTVHAAVRDVERRRGARSGATSALHAVRRDLRDPGPLVRARRRRPARGAVQPRGREQRRRLVRRPARHVGVERGRRRRACSTRVRARQPGDALLPGLLGRDVRLDAGRERRPRRDRGAQPAEPVRGREGRRAHALPSYRESYGIRIACGILFNHESHRRGPQFLSRKVVDHVAALRAGAAPAAARAREPEGAARLGLRARTTSTG